MLTWLQRVFGHPGLRIGPAAYVTHYFQPFERPLSTCFHVANVHLTALPQIFCPLRLEGQAGRCPTADCAGALGAGAFRLDLSRNHQL